MSNLIIDVRSKTNVGTTDYTVNAVDYFSDDQIQKALDKYRELVYREDLTIVDEYADASTETHGYYWRWDDVELATTAGAFVLTEGDGTIIASGYTIDYDQRRIQFDDDTFDEGVYLTYYTYDVNAAVADIWDQIATFEAMSYDVATDGHDLKRSQKRKAAMDAAAEWRTKARGPVTGKTIGGTKRIVRSDVRGY